MPIIAPGAPAPDFRLRREDGSDFTREDLLERTTVLVFYPFAFSSVCTDQLQVYEEAIDEIRARGAEMLAVSTDATEAQRAFREQLGISVDGAWCHLAFAKDRNIHFPLLSDFEPKGEASRAFGAYFEPGGMTTRALVIVGPDQTVQWSWIGEHPGILPGANLIFDGLAGART